MLFIVVTLVAIVSFVTGAALVFFLRTAVVFFYFIFF